MDSIASIGATRPVDPGTRTHRAGPTSRTEEAGKKSEFGEALDDTLGEVGDMQKKADRAALGLSAGKVEDVHQVMIAMNEADLAFRMMLEVRNRIVDAYKEISRLQV